MRIHCNLHETFEGPGCINDWIKQKDYITTASHTYLNETYPSMEQFDWLIIMGGTMSTYEEEKHKWLQAEKKFIRQAIESDKIVLGICFGAQMIAEALGGKVYPAKEQEIGWFPIDMNKNNLPAGLSPLPVNPTVFHWHGDTFDLPDEAVHLASSEATINQAFIYHNRVMALQYHHELTTKAISLMNEKLGAQLSKARYVQSAEEIMKGVSHIDENSRIMFKIMDYLDSCK